MRARPENFAPEVRAAIDATPAAFERLAREMAWGRVEFISDMPGKNGSRWLSAAAARARRRWRSWWPARASPS